MKGCINRERTVDLVNSKIQKAWFLFVDSMGKSLNQFLVPKEMRVFFIFITLGYIACIFLLAESSMVCSLSPFNPYSLLHLPLYGILTILLFLSFVPTAFRFDQSEKPITLLPNHFILRLLGVMLISFAIAVADEIHQAYLPAREASIIDVFLDMFGTILIILLIMLYYKKRIQKS